MELRAAYVKEQFPQTESSGEENFTVYRVDRRLREKNGFRRDESSRHDAARVEVELQVWFLTTCRESFRPRRDSVPSHLEPCGAGTGADDFGKDRPLSAYYQTREP